MRGGGVDNVKFAGIYTCIVLVGVGGGIFAAWVVVTLATAYTDGWTYIFGGGTLSDFGYCLSLLYAASLLLIQSIKD